jgi:hypothetical protein
MPLLGLLALALFAPATAVTVTTQYGQVQGAPSAANPAIVDFLGLPFAAPPLGALRWAPPAPPVAWPGVRPATTQPPSCLQPESGAGGAAVSEDCLYLNGVAGVVIERRGLLLLLLCGVVVRVCARCHPPPPLCTACDPVQHVLPCPVLRMV